MLPHEPPRSPQLGFLFFPPYRVQGYSIAGEETVVQIPELDVCFDIGRAPKVSLSSNFVALSHGHMDHVAGLAYYFSQRYFQGMGVGTVYCHQLLVEPIRQMMGAWMGIERQQTPFRVVPIEPGPDGDIELKNHCYLRAFENNHTNDALSFAIIERRSKLKEALRGLPQEKLVERKQAGEEITETHEIPHIAYMGDVEPCGLFAQPEIVNAEVLITECTFFDDDHRERARVGRHLHLSDLLDLLPRLNAEHIVLTHLSRRTHIMHARETLDRLVPKEHRSRIHLLMDGRTNRARYQEQVEAAEAKEKEKAST